MEDRVVIVTGAAGGLGASIARVFAREGARVCLVDMKPASELAQQIEAEGGSAFDIPTDVSRKGDIEIMVGRCREVFGRVDVLVNVAGTTSFGSAEALAEEEWDRVLSINLKGAFLCSQAVIGLMREQGFGRIINIGSALAKNGGNPRPWVNPEEQDSAANVAYGVSKAGVHAMTLYLSKEVAGHGVTVNCVAPGPIASAMTTQLPQRVKDAIPLGRMGQPNDVAEAVLFLASDSASYITGEILDVNGGLWGD